MFYKLYTTMKFDSSREVILLEVKMIIYIFRTVVRTVVRSDKQKIGKRAALTWDLALNLFKNFYE